MGGAQLCCILCENSLCDTISNVRNYNPHLLLLLAGDIIALSIVTLFGFSSHGSFGSGRFWATFVPLIVAWSLSGFYGGIFEITGTLEARRLWRPFLGMVLAAPLAVWMRAIWLEVSIVPIFVVVIGGFSALAILVWRGIFILWMKSR
jgi:hypothetical protein